MISRYPTVVLVFPHVYYICLIATLLQNQLTIHRLHHHFCLHTHITSHLTQYDTSAYPECHFLLQHLYHYLYLSTDYNLDFFQYLLVDYPFFPDQYFHLNQSLHSKYLLHCRYRFLLIFLIFVFLNLFYLLLVVH